MPEENLIQNNLESKQIYSSNINDNLLVKDKGSIKLKEKDLFIENLERDHLQMSLKRYKKSKTNLLEDHKSPRKYSARKYSVRKHKSRNQIKRSITVSPKNCFGPKIHSPTHRKIKKSKKTVKKDSSSTIKSIKSKKTNFSSSKRLSRMNFTNLIKSSYRGQIRKSSILEKISEGVENDPLNMTILDL